MINSESLKHIPASYFAQAEIWLRNIFAQVADAKPIYYRVLNADEKNKVRAKQREVNRKRAGSKKQYKIKW